MAIGFENVSLSAVRNELGASTSSLAALAIHPNINKWSRYKPIRLHNANPANWYKASDGRYGLSLPIGLVGNLNSAGWNYLKPNSEYRLGDFRGYSNSHIPPFYVGSWQSEDTDDYADFALLINTNTANGISIADFGLGWENWYFGIRLAWDGFEAFVTAVDPVTSPAGKLVHVDMRDGLLSGASGKLYSWEAFLTDTAIALVSDKYQQINFDILNQPSIYAPEYDIYPASGTFTFDLNLIVYNISVISHDTNNMTISNASGYVNDGSTQCHITFTPYNLDTDLVYYKIYYRTTYVGGGVISNCANGVEKSATLPANQAANDGLISVRLNDQIF